MTSRSGHCERKPSVRYQLNRSREYAAALALYETISAGVHPSRAFVETLGGRGKGLAAGISGLLGFGGSMRTVEDK